VARIRSLKPEFPQSESMGRVSRDARLTFLCLWTIADDEGRTRGHSRALASLLYPYDDDAPALIDGWLHELEHEGCIVRYVLDGTHYLQICNWLKHQKIDKPSKSRIPPQREVSTSPREDSRTLDDGSRILDLGSKDLGSVAVATNRDSSERSPSTVTPRVLGRRTSLVPGRDPNAAYQCEAFKVPMFLHEKFRGRLANAHDPDPEATLHAWYRRLRDEVNGRDISSDDVKWLTAEYDRWRKPTPVQTAHVIDPEVAAWVAGGTR